MHKQRFVDFHMHTTYSDGGLTPDELVKFCVRHGIQRIAITDHSNVEGYCSLKRKRKKHKIKITPGVELSTLFRGDEHHILGLGVDVRNKRFRNELIDRMVSRERKIRGVVLKLQELGFIISFGEVRRQTPGFLMEHHVILALMKRYVNRRRVYRELGPDIDVFEIINAYFAKGAPAELDKELLDPKEAIDLITDAGGKAVLAHPGAKVASKEKARLLIGELVEFGLDGVEAITPKHSSKKTKLFISLADELGLFVTAGSDFHYVSIPGVYARKPQTHVLIDPDLYKIKNFFAE